MSSKVFAILIVFIAVLSGCVYKNNPVLFGKCDKSYTFFDRSVYEFYPELDDELFFLASKVDRDLGAYRNHCLRVLTFTKYFLPESAEKSIPDAMDLAATAIAYHRIGLWTDNNLNYIDSSKDQFEGALGDAFPPEKMNIMREIILQQHKITDYDGMNSDAANDIVNAIRKASWVDATMGLIRFDLPASLLETAYEQLEGAGFHRKIWGKGMKLSREKIASYWKPILSSWDLVHVCDKMPVGFC